MSKLSSQLDWCSSTKPNSTNIKIEEKKICSFDMCVVWYYHADYNWIAGKLKRILSYYLLGNYGGQPSLSYHIELGMLFIFSICDWIGIQLIPTYIGYYYFFFKMSVSLHSICPKLKTQARTFDQNSSLCDMKTTTKNTNTYVVCHKWQGQ